MYSLPILLAYFSLFVLGSIDNLRGPLYPTILETLQLDTISGSWIFTATSLFSLIFSVLSPAWLRWLSPQKALKYSLILQIFVLVLMGWAFSLSSYSLIILSSVLLGVAMGIQGICVNTVLSIESNVGNSRRLFSGLHAMYGLSSLSIPLIVNFFINKDVSYQMMLFCLAIITMVPTIYFILKVKEKNDNVVHAMDWRFANKELLILSFTLCMYVNSEILVSSRLVLFLQKAGGLSVNTASIFLSLFFVGLLLGRIIFSIIKFEVNSLKLLKISVISSFIVYTVGLFYIYEVLFLIGLTSSFFFPCFMDFIKKNMINPDTTIAKVMIFVSLSLAIMHSVFGQIGNYFGINLAMGLNLLFYPLILYFLHFKVDSLRRIT